MRVLVFLLGIAAWQFLGIVGAALIGVPYITYEIWKAKHD